MARTASPKAAQAKPVMWLGDTNELLRHCNETGGKMHWALVRCAGYDLDENGKRHYHHLEQIPCNCPEGPQVWQMWTKTFETWCVGSRGSAKSEGTFGFLIRGNPRDWTSNHPSGCDASYTNHPGYTALIVRKDAQDLDDYFARLKMLVEPMGAHCTTAPMKVQWPSGATWYFAHLKDEDSILKQQGKSYTRIVCEEAGQIPTEKLYIMALVGSCRSKYPELRPQIMLVSNPGGRGHCVPYGEVLTPDGWKDIKDFEVGDPVYTVDQSGELVETQVAQTHASYYNGKLVEYDARGFHMCCTPNHAVAKVGGVKGKPVEKFSLVPVSSLPGQATILRSVEWKGTPIDSFTVNKWPCRKLELDQPLTLTGMQYAALLGWYLSEGSTVDRDKSFSIAQEKPAGVAAISALLESCGFSYQWNGCNATITSPDWWAYLRGFGHSHEKYIPDALKNSTKEQLRALFDALVAGDGRWETPGKSGHYYTCSKQLADDVCEVALKLGYIVYLYERQRDNRKYRSYAVCFKTAVSGGTELLTGNHLYNVPTKTKRASLKNERDFSGMVYCLGIEGTHSFVIRQKGCIWVSGNSWLNKRFRFPHRGSDAWPKLTPFEWKDEDGLVLTRQWIHSTVNDNPYYLQGNASYVASLKMLKDTDPTLYRQWYLGDPDAVEGQFFERFRRKHLAGEPANACHVITCRKHPDGSLAEEPIAIKPWFPRAMSIDWGYFHPAVVLWGLFDEQKRLHVYRELKVQTTGTVELGASIAKITAPDLMRMQTPQITVHLSHDAFHRTDYSNTEAEQIAEGIDMVLGKNGAFVVAANLDEESMEEAERKRSLESRLASDGARAMIRLVPAGGAKRRKPGWTKLRDMMRWWSLADTDEVRQATVNSIMSKQGYEALSVYLQQQESLKAQVLPVLQIWDTCPNVIAGIENAQKSEHDCDDVEKQDGDDEVDALNYLVMGFQQETLNKPHEVWVAERVRQAMGNGPSNIGRLIALNDMAEREWAMRNVGRGVTASRFARRQGMRLQ